MVPAGKNMESAMLDLQLMWTYQLAADMEQKLGLPAIASLYRLQAEKMKKTIQKKYWDPRRKLYADTELKNHFSQHTNSLAILSGMMNATAAHELGKKLLEDTTLTQASIYFKYYLHLALVKSGWGDDYLNWLDIWNRNIEMGLTTWAEISEISFARSDCHAWGSSPNIELFRTVLGIDSDAPGFRKVKIDPHLGKLTKAYGEIILASGKITVDYSMNNNKLNATIVLPVSITGRFIWKGKVYILKSGRNIFKI
jgi:hypothetical protein